MSDTESAASEESSHVETKEIASKETKTTANSKADSEGQDLSSKDYIKTLRDENKKRRIENTEVQEQVKALKETSVELEKRFALSQERILNAEIKTAAVQAGIKDTSLAIKLIEKKDLKISEDGEIDGLGTAMTGLKENYPYLFGEEKISSMGAAVKKPAATEKTAVNFSDMSDAEYQKHRAAFLSPKRK